MSSRFNLYWSLDENHIYVDNDGINDGRMVQVDFLEDFGRATKRRKIEVLEEMVKFLKNSKK